MRTRSKFSTCTKFSMCTHILNVYTRTCVHTHTSRRTTVLPCSLVELLVFHQRTSQYHDRDRFERWKACRHPCTGSHSYFVDTSAPYSGVHHSLTHTRPSNCEVPPWPKFTQYCRYRWCMKIQQKKCPNYHRSTKSDSAF